MKSKRPVTIVFAMVAVLFFLGWGGSPHPESLAGFVPGIVDAHADSWDGGQTTTYSLEGDPDNYDGGPGEDGDPDNYDGGDEDPKPRDADPDNTSVTYILVVVGSLFNSWLTSGW